MKKIYKFDDGRISFFGIIIENRKLKAFGFWIEFSTQEWEIIVSIGYGLGRIWFVIPHKFLYRNFRKLFDGKNFGEWGREIGFMISENYKSYSLWWWSDPNKPHHKWRSKYYIK